MCVNFGGLKRGEYWAASQCMAVGGVVVICSFSQMAGEFGYGRLFTKGLGTRVLMIGTLTGLQWWIYDTFKVRPAQAGLCLNTG